MLLIHIYFFFLISYSCEPIGGFNEDPDPVQFRVGKAPTGPFKELLLNLVKEIEEIMKNPQHFLKQADISKAMKDLKEALAKVYPMGIPDYDPIRMEIENRECLQEFHNTQLTNVADPQDTKLWFSSKELMPGQCLGDFLKKKKKTKVIIKIASLKSGQPSREPLLSEKDQHMLLAHSAKRREEMIALAKNSDDSYHDSPWADQGGLKRKMCGLDNISWKPGQF